ncbi:MAG: hypothetical protein ACLFVJ_13735 [Persicimonas sp.]
MSFRTTDRCRRYLYGLTLALLLAVGLTVAPQSALAADDAPLRLIFVNSDPTDGESAYEVVEEILEASDDMSLKPPEELLDAAADYGVSLDDFRAGDKRVEHEDDFRQMIEQVEAEAILLIDIFGSGRTMQFVIIGPRGDELQDVRYTISGGQPSQSEAIEALRKAFKELVPEVRAYREEMEQKQQPDTEVDLLGEEDDRELTAKQRAAKRFRENHSDLSVGATPTVGVIFGRRSMVLDTEASYNLDHASPFVGVGGEVSGIFTLLDSGRAAIGGTAFGAFAPFSTSFPGEDGEAASYASSYTNVGADVKYIAGLSSDVRLHGKVGAEMVTIGIAANNDYTGHSYINLRAGAGLAYGIGELAELHLGGAALPTVHAEMSGNALGEADFGVGVNAAGRLHLTLFEPIDASIGYDFRFYEISFPSPELAALEGEAASTTDMYHVANVMVGYGF